MAVNGERFELVQSSKEHDNVADETGHSQNDQRLVVGFAPCQSTDNQSSCKHSLKCQIARIGQPVIENEVLAYTYGDCSEREQKEPGPMGIETGFQVDILFGRDIREHQARNHIDKDGVEQDDGKLEESPVMPVSHSEH